MNPVSVFVINYRSIHGGKMLIPCCQRVGQFVNKWFTGIGRFPTGHPIRSIEQVTDYEIVIFHSGSTKKKIHKK